MKRIVCLFALLAVVAAPGFAEKRMVFKEDATSSVTTAGALYEVPAGGYLSIFANQKLYINFDPDGVTPNSDSDFIAAGGRVDTELYYYTGQKIGVLADTGTATFNVTVYGEAL